MAGPCTVGPFDPDARLGRLGFGGAGIADKQQFGIEIQHEERERTGEPSIALVRMPISAPFERTNSGTRSSGVTLSLGSTVMVAPLISLE